MEIDIALGNSVALRYLKVSYDNKLVNDSDRGIFGEKRFFLVNEVISSIELFPGA
jgi:hypothetical protein